MRKTNHSRLKFPLLNQLMYKNKTPQKWPPFPVRVHVVVQCALFMAMLLLCVLVLSTFLLIIGVLVVGN